MRNPRVWIRCLVVAVVLAVAAIFTVPTATTHLPIQRAAYPLCEPTSVAQLNTDVVKQVNDAQAKYKVPKDGMDLAVRTLPDTFVVSVHVTFMSDYCGYQQMVLLSPGPHTRPGVHYMPDPYVTDTVEYFYRGKPMSDDAVCISNKAMPSWTYAQDGSFQLVVTCDRLYSWDTWGQTPFVLTEIR